MHPKTLFRVLIKFLGLCLVILGLIKLVPDLVWLVNDLYGEGSRYGSALAGPFRWMRWAQTACYLAAGLYLLLGGGWLVNVLIRSRSQSCPHCGYQLHTRQVRCPECGASTPSELAKLLDSDGVDST